MSSYNIAGLTVNFEPLGRTEKQARRYLAAPCASPDVTLRVRPGLVDKYMAEHPELDRDSAYYLVSGIEFYHKLSAFDGMLLHSSALMLDGKAYLFSGQCGIGKSTHAAYWRRLLGDRVTVLNDDKPAVRIIDGVPYAFGTPWSGKHDMSENAGAPIGGVCFISRGTDNEITRLPPRVAAARIIDQSGKASSEERWGRVLSVIDRTVASVPVYLLRCIDDVSAARLSVRTMTGENV